MSDSLKLRATCSLCMGTGESDSKDGDGNQTKVPCESCGQTGKLVIGEIDGAETMDWIVRKIKKILHKLELPED